MENKLEQLKQLKDNLWEQIHNLDNVIGELDPDMVYWEELDCYIAKEDAVEHQGNTWKTSKVEEIDMNDYRAWTVMTHNTLLQKDLSASQKLILQIWRSMESSNRQHYIFTQRALCELTGITNKGIRSMLEDMKEKGYIKRGLKAATWELECETEWNLNWDSIK